MSSTEPWRNPRPAPNLDEVRYRVPPHSMIPSWLRAWWPAMLWAAVIFSASTDTFSSDHTSRIIVPMLHWLFPSLSLASLDLAHHVIRKCAHVAEYFIFLLLVYRGVRGAHRGWRWSSGFAAWFLVAGYSALDEIHQSFVASRGASAWDSLLDSTAALFALMVVFLFYRFVRRTRPAEA
jgi:VanZ family protein